jgi:phospholipase/lecithinase/hemolysin
MWQYSAPTKLAASFADASVPAYTTVFAFGDSLSDAGNVWIANGRPNTYPYYRGHASNGLTWVEDLSKKLGLGTLTPSLAGGHDYAYGGAESGPTAIEGASANDLLGQVAQYGLKYPQYQGALYTLDIGTNDIDKALNEFAAGKINIYGVGTVVAQAEANTVLAVQTLFALGARNLLFYGVPDLGKTPYFRAEGPAWQNLASGLAQSFDQTVLGDLAPQESLGLKVYDLDMYDLLDDVVRNPTYGSKYGITFANVTEPWVGSGSPLSEANQYLFFDILHPTAAGHHLTADIASHTLAAPPLA